MNFNLLRALYSSLLLLLALLFLGCTENDGTGDNVAAGLPMQIEAFDNVKLSADYLVEGLIRGPGYARFTMRMEQLPFGVKEFHGMRVFLENLEDKLPLATRRLSDQDIPLPSESDGAQKFELDVQTSVSPDGLFWLSNSFDLGRLIPMGESRSVLATIEVDLLFHGADKPQTSLVTRLFKVKNH